MKTIWAVACVVAVSMGSFTLGGGCASTKSEMTEFSRLDVGEGPGETYKQLIELQKDQGNKSASTELDKKTSLVPQTTVSSEVPEAKPSKSPEMEVSQSSQTINHRTDSSSGMTSGTVPLQKSKPEALPIPAPSPPKAVSPSGTEPSKKEASARASSGAIPPAVPLPSSTARNPSSSTDSQYRIGPEDILHVSVWGNEQLTMDVIVRPDGKISIPLVQDTQAEGLTASELADQIHEKLLPYIKDPNVSVIVKEINSPKFSVIGYVNRPGTFPMRGDVTILQALSEAGGFTPFASPSKIKLVRNAGGRQEVRVVDYYDLIEKGGKGNILLKPGDAIVVP